MHNALKFVSCWCAGIGVGLILIGLAQRLGMRVSYVEPRVVGVVG